MNAAQAFFVLLSAGGIAGLFYLLVAPVLWACKRPMATRLRAR